LPSVFSGVFSYCEASEFSSVFSGVFSFCETSEFPSVFSGVFSFCETSEFSSVFSGVFSFCVVFCQSLLVFLSFLLLVISLSFFYLQLLITLWYLQRIITLGRKYQRCCFQLIQESDCEIARSLHDWLIPLNHTSLFCSHKYGAVWIYYWTKTN
jgi:hypothetical protein